MPYKDRETRLNYHRNYNKTYYQRNKKKIIIASKRSFKRLVVWFRELKKTKSCIRCGEKDWRCLDFHHRDPSTKKFNVSSMTSNIWGRGRILEEIEKCDVLCANCHRKEHIKEDCTGNQVGPSSF